MNSLIILIFSAVLLFFLTVKGIKKEYRTITHDTYFSVSQTDWLRGLAIVGIVYSHYFTMLKVNSSFLWLIGFLGVFGVAIFLFLSGYAAMMSYLKKPNYMKNYIPKRLVRLYVPFLIAYLCCDIVLLLSGHSYSVSDFTGAFILSLPNTLIWYLKV